MRAALILLGGLFAGPVSAQVLLSSGFELGLVEADPAWHVAGNAPVAQTAIVRSGKYAIRSYLNRDTSEVSYRTEARAEAPWPARGQDTWYGFSIYLPAPYPADPIGEILAQWHRKPDAGDAPENPPIALKVIDGNWQVGTEFLGTKTLGSYANDIGRWVDWVFRIRWSPGSDGEYQVWKNGQPVIATIKGQNTFDDALMPYFKIGIYKPIWKYKVTPGINQRIVYHDEFKMMGANGSLAAMLSKRPMPPTLLTIE